MCVYFPLMKCADNQLTDNHNNKSHTWAFHNRITKCKSAQSASFFSDLWCLIQTKACSYLPASSLSQLWTLTSRVMPLIPLLLLNKEAYGGLLLWSCSVLCFLLRALQLSGAFPTVHRQSRFAVKTHEEVTPLHNNNSNNKKVLPDMSHQMLLSALTTMEVQNTLKHARTHTHGTMRIKDTGRQTHEHSVTTL